MVTKSRLTTPRAGINADNFRRSPATRGAIVSLQKAVTLNPRQFAAMTELGSILDSDGDKRDALKMCGGHRRSIHNFRGDRSQVGQLTGDVEGDKI